MGILELHFHDAEFSWTMNPGTDRERSLSLGIGSESATGGQRDRPALGPKLGSFAVLALVVGAGAAFNRLRSRRARAAAEREQAESRGRFARLRSR